jgi:hypothetical protein
VIRCRLLLAEIHELENSVTATKSRRCELSARIPQHMLLSALMSEPRSEPELVRPPQRELEDTSPAHRSNVPFSSLAVGANIVEVQVRDQVLWINEVISPTIEG